MEAPLGIVSIFQIFCTILMFFLMDAVGSISRGYVRLDKILESTNFSYNILFRTLFPAVYISFLSLILYKTGLSFLVIDIWHIAIYYTILNFTTLILLRRWQLVNKPIFFIIHFFGITIAYWVYVNGLKLGINAILPDAGNFRTELWFIIIGFFYTAFKDFTPDYGSELNRKNKFLLNNFNKLSKRYDYLLKNEYINNFQLRLIFYSIMITEDINRPPFIRLLEKILFPTGRIKTTGIMQVTNKKYLSDSESIKEAQKIILESYLKHIKSFKSDEEYQFVNKIAYDYNSGGYGSEISENFVTLKALLVQ